MSEGIRCKDLKGFISDANESIFDPNGLMFDPSGLFHSGIRSRSYAKSRHITKRKSIELIGRGA